MLYSFKYLVVILIMETTFNLVKKNQILNFNNFIENINEDEIYSLVDLLIKYKEKNIFTLGVGKCSSLAIYFSDILKSLSLKSFNINVTNITHGDLGCISKDDITILISKSGNTTELTKIIELIDSSKILLSCNRFSNISRKVDKTFVIPYNNESDLFFNLIPTNSSTNFISFINFLINLYIERSNINFDKYKSNHPSGDIGFKTKKIRNFINEDITICNNFDLCNDDVMSILLSSKNGIIFEKNNIFVGILTTKDVLKNVNNLSSKSIYDFINKNPIVLNNPDELMINKIDLIKRYKLFKFIPILEKGKCIGILDNSLIIELN